jgi:GT2 family glycosyltransferase
MQTEEPSVLAVVVTRHGAAWLPRTLRALARQTHPRLGVLAIDNASTDGSAELLEKALGSRRVIRLDQDLGFAGSIRRVMEVPAVQNVDFLLLLHDDVALAPQAVARLVEEAGRVQGAGMVGPKVLDWEGRVLLEVGFSTDRFAYPHSPLEEGEIDQGQYDAPREVLFVSSAAMLVSRPALERVGPPDDRLAPARDDLDFCWRIRLAGYRVLVTPRAVAVHRMARERGERSGAHPPRPRYETERASLAAILVNYRVLTLLWVLPLYGVQGLGRLLLYLLGRRFDRAGEILAAWGWNIVHLPGSVSRRARARAIRRVPDREIVRFMSPTGARLQRWATQAAGLLVGRRAAQVEEGEELESPPLRQRVASVVSDHPVAFAWIGAAIVTAVAFRDVLFAQGTEGGAYPVLPPDAASFFEAFASAWRPTGFGGPELASPALVPLGLGSYLTLGDPQLLGRLLVGLGPIAAGASCYGAVRRLGPGPGAAAVAAVSYAAAAPALWAASEGRISVIVMLAALPIVVSRLVAGFAPGGPARPLRWAVGTGMALAAAVAFEPSSWIAVALMALPLMVLPERRGSRTRGLVLAAGAAVIAGVLLFPFVATLAQAGGTPGPPARARFADLLLLAPGPGPGSGVTAAFLPVAGVLAFAVAAERRAAWRALVTAAAGIPLAWLAAAGRLPVPTDEPVPYLAASALSLAFLVGLGVAGMPHGVRRAAFGTPQIVAALTTAVLVLGLAGQAIRILPGNWAVGQDRVAPAWPVVTSTEPGTPFRVLWLGPDDGLPFPPPGGDPEGVTVTERIQVAYAVTGRAGRSLLAIGLPPDEPALVQVESILTAMLEGRISHAGALLGPMGIRFVVAGEDRLPATAARRLGEQVDLDLVQRAGGLSIYRNARAVPPAAVLPAETAVAAARSEALLAAAHLSGVTAGRLHGGPEVLTGTAPEGGVSLLLVTDRFDPRWRARSPAGEVAPFPAFGWALGFEGLPGPVTVGFEGGTRRTVELAALGVLWAVALWSIRRTSRDERPTRRSMATATAQAPAVPEVSRT